VAGRVDLLRTIAYEALAATQVSEEIRIQQLNEQLIEVGMDERDCESSLFGVAS